MNLNGNSIIAYYSGREPYPHEKIIVFSNKTYTCVSIYDHYAGAGDSGNIPKRLIVNGKLIVGDLCTYLSSQYAYFKGDKFCKDIIDFNTFTLTHSE